MLTIRKEQMDAFLPQDDPSIISFMIEHLTDEYNDYIADLSDSALRKRIVNGLKRARQYGFDELEGQTVFVSWMFAIAPNFDQQPELKNILQETTVSVEERIEKMMTDELESSWIEAKQNYNNDAWFPEIQDEEQGSIE